MPRPQIRGRRQALAPTAGCIGLKLLRGGTRKSSLIREDRPPRGIKKPTSGITPPVRRAPPGLGSCAKGTFRESLANATGCDERSLRVEARRPPAIADIDGLISASKLKISVVQLSRPQRASAVNLEAPEPGDHSRPVQFGYAVNRLSIPPFIHSQNGICGREQYGHLLRSPARHRLRDRQEATALHRAGRKR